MKQFTSIFTVCLVALSFVACSSFQNNASNQNTSNLTEKPLALATEAYELLGGDENSKILVTGDLGRAYSAYGATQTVIKRLLKKYDEAKTSDAKDNELDTIVRTVIDEKKPDFKKALTFAKNIKKPETKTEVLLRIAEIMPKNERLPVLREVDKAIATTKITKYVYKKRSKLLKLAKMYFDSGNKQNARKTILASHDLLIRNTSSSNAYDFGKVAELESQLDIHPSTLCELTRFLHKTKDRPIALAKITAAYMNHGYQGQVCIPDKELIATVRSMPNYTSQARQQLVLAEAWHTQKKQEKSEQLYNGAIKSVKRVSPQHYQFDTQTKILISLKKTANKKLFNSVSKDYWKQVNKQSPYEQSGTLMQMVMEAYDVEGLTDLSFDALSKMKENSLKETTGVQLARMAHERNDKIVVTHALNAALSSAKVETHPVQKVGYLIEVIETAQDIENTEIVTQALKIADKSIDKLDRKELAELKILYSFQLIEQAWAHKDYLLAESLLKRTKLWHKQFLKQPKPKETGTSDMIAYLAEAKVKLVIRLMESHILLGRYSEALAMINRLQTKKSQAKALVYAAITLAKKRRKQGATKKDTTMLNALENNIQRIRKNIDQKNKT